MISLLAPLLVTAAISFCPLQGYDNTVLMLSNVTYDSKWPH